MPNDKLHSRRNAERQQRKTDILNQKMGTWLIVSEGEKTEPNYFKLAVEDINSGLSDEQKIKLDIKGQGMNTVSLVQSANDFIYEIDKYRNKTPIYGKVFVVFDKDSFEDKAFDEAISMCESQGWIPLWSNEAFELWFLLHFNYNDAALSRTLYATKINEYFKQNGLKYKYEKNDSKIYSLLNQYGSLDRAIKNAKKLHLDVHKNDVPSKSNCCTTVYKFFEVVDEIKNN